MHIICPGLPAFIDKQDNLTSCRTGGARLPSTHCVVNIVSPGEFLVFKLKKEECIGGFQANPARLRRTQPMLSRPRSSASSFFPLLFFFSFLVAFRLRLRSTCEPMSVGWIGFASHLSFCRRVAGDLSGGMQKETYILCTECNPRRRH